MTITLPIFSAFLAIADRYGKNRESGAGFHPKRQVYVFLTVSEDGKHVKTLTVDAETKRPLSKCGFKIKSRRL